MSWIDKVSTLPTIPGGAAATGVAPISMLAAVRIELDLPLLQSKDYTAPSLFSPTNLLREARRQKNLLDVAVPHVGLIDPDGDTVRYLAASGRGRRHPGWACYHTDMWTVDLGGLEIGVVGLAVGAPVIVLVAEQLERVSRIGETASGVS